MDWKVLLGVCAFLAFLGWDIVGACRRRDLLIQGRALVLSGLTVQLLGYFDIQNVNVFGQNQEQELQMLFNKQISTDISRLTFCVFLGYVLPDVAFAQSGGRWTNIAALVVSFSFHTATEVYVLQNVNNPAIRNEGGGLFISSIVLLSVVTIYLVLFLGSAILNGKFLRDKLVCMIPQLFPQNEEDGGKMIKGKMLEAWVVARACLEQNWLETSLFAPFVAIMVTICVAVVAAKAGCQKCVLHSNVGLSFYLRCTFILIGWIIILWRSFLVNHYYVSQDTSIQSGHGHSLDNFCRLIYLYIQIALDPMPLYNALHSKGAPFPIVQYVLKVLRILPSIFALAVPLISCLFLGSYFLLIFLLLPLLLLTYLLRIVAKKLKFIDLERVWVCGQRFIVAASSYKETKKSMEKAYENGQKRGELLLVIERSVAENRKMVVSELQHRQHWKMAAVAAISVIVELADGCNVDEEAQVAIKAFRQAEDLLEVIDCPDNIALDPTNLFDTCRHQAYRLNLEAQSKMLKLENLFRNGKQRYSVLTLDEVDKVIGWFGKGNEFGESPRARGRHISFYQDWAIPRLCGLDVEALMIEKRKSMEYVCKVISQRHYINKEELMNVAVNCLGDIIGACVLQLPDVLLQHRVYWARDFEEDKSRKAVEIAAKLCGVIEKWNPYERKTEKCEDNEVAQRESTRSEVTEE